MGVPSRSVNPREHNWDQPPTHSHRNLDPRSPGLPRPGCAPGAFPAAVATTEWMEEVGYSPWGRKESDMTE